MLVRVVCLSRAGIGVINCNPNPNLAIVDFGMVSKKTARACSLNMLCLQAGEAIFQGQDGKHIKFFIQKNLGVEKIERLHEQIMVCC